MFMGYVIAVITSLIFAAYVVPRKFATTGAFVYNSIVAGAVLTGGLIGWIFSILGLLPPVQAIEVLKSVPIGILWTLGSMTLIVAIDRIGLARSNQWKNLQGPIAVVLALIFMGEAVKANLASVLAGALLVFLSAAALSIPSGKTSEEKANDRRGILLALAAAALFGLAATYTKVFAGSSATPSLALGSSIGFASASWLILAFRRELKPTLTMGKREFLLAFAAGTIFYLSIWSMALTFRYLPVSVGYTIIQLNSIWVVLVGVFLFREIKFSQHRGRILLGLGLAVLGIVALAF